MSQRAVKEADHHRLHRDRWHFVAASRRRLPGAGGRRAARHRPPARLRQQRNLEAQQSDLCRIRDPRRSDRRRRLGRGRGAAVPIGAASTTVLKGVFTRPRPIEANDPNEWFKGHGHHSFPSGEVALASAAVTPFVLEYGKDHPAVYALEALPAYDAIARMKVQAHWQTDVIAGFAIGTAAGYYAYHRDTPLILSVMPHQVTVGLKKRF